MVLMTGQVLAVVGTLATETGNATYVGLSANNLSMMVGVATGPDSSKLLKPRIFTFAPKR